MPKTRSEAGDDGVIGASKELSELVLPTRKDVLKYYKWVLQESSDFTPSFADVSIIVAERIVEIWRRASIPTVSLRRIKNLIKKERDQENKFNKSFKRDNSSPIFQKKNRGLLGRSRLLIRCCCVQMY